MTRRSRRAWQFRMLGAASGLLLLAGALASWAVPLSLVALLPLLYVAAYPKAPLRIALTAGLCAAVVYAVPQVLLLRMSPGVGLGLLVDVAVVTSMFAGLSWWILRRRWALSALAVGALLALLDWVNFTLVPIWGTAQSLARPSSRYPHLIQYVSLTGITGVVFAAGSFQALVLIVSVRRRRRARPAWALAGLLAALVAASLLARPWATAGSLKVAAVGWATEDVARRGAPDSRRGFEALDAAPVAAAAGQGARLVVSPELAFTFDGGEAAAWRKRFAEIAREHGVFLAIGYRHRPKRENRLLFMDPAGAVLAEYVKTHLVPFEDFEAGDGEPAAIDLDGVRVGGMICQDDNFTDLSRAYGRMRAAVVAVPTKDWRAVKDAHFQSSVHRAIESRYAVVRAAWGGISAIVSGRGRVLARRDHFADGAGVIVADVPLTPRRTPFSVLGHWPAAASLLFLLGYGAWRVCGGRVRRGRAF